MNVGRRNEVFCKYFTLLLSLQNIFCLPNGTIEGTYYVPMYVSKSAVDLFLLFKNVKDENIDWVNGICMDDKYTVVGRNIYEIAGPPSTNIEEIC